MTVVSFDIQRTFVENELRSASDGSEDDIEPTDETFIVGGAVACFVF